MLIIVKGFCTFDSFKKKHNQKINLFIFLAEKIVIEKINRLYKQ
jgi:hypothetical protein